MSFSDINDAEIEKRMECAQPDVDNSKGTTSPPISDSSSLVDSKSHTSQKASENTTADTNGLHWAKDFDSFYDVPTHLSSALLTLPLTIFDTLKTVHA